MLCQLSVSLQKRNPNQLLMYSIEVNTCIGFWILKTECTQYEICGEVAFKNARTMVFWEVGRGMHNFSGGSRKPGFFVGQLPLPISTSPKGS
jgi:hypothetical protein